MDVFLKKYQGHRFEDWGAYCSDDYKAFARKFKNYLKRNLSKDCELIGFKANHYDTSGFVKYKDVYVYISTSWNRYSPVDIYQDGYMDGVLIRFAKDERDFIGERNEYTSLSNLPEYINEMFERRTI